MSFEIIQIKNNDKEIVDRIKEIDRGAFGDTGIDEWIIVPFLRHGRIMVLKYDNKIVGSCVFFRDWENQTLAYLYSIAVDSSYRGKGLGTRFLKDCLSMIKKEGIECVELTVDASNHGAVKVYKEKLGFEVVGQRDNEYGEGEDRLVMEIHL